AARVARRPTERTTRILRGFTMRPGPRLPRRFCEIIFVMRRLLFAALLVLTPTVASARAWHGLTPGLSTKSDVLKKFGSPTRKLPMTARYGGGLVYQAKESQEFGADEAQFFFDEKGKLADVFV